MGHSDAGAAHVLQSSANTIHLTLEHQAGQLAGIERKFERASDIRITQRRQALRRALLLQPRDLGLDLTPFSDGVSVCERQLRLLVPVRVDAVDQAVDVAFEGGLEVDLEQLAWMLRERSAVVD